MEGMGRDKGTGCPTPGGLSPLTGLSHGRCFGRRQSGGGRGAAWGPAAPAWPQPPAVLPEPQNPCLASCISHIPLGKQLWAEGLRRTYAGTALGALHVPQTEAGTFAWGRGAVGHCALPAALHAVLLQLSTAHPCSCPTPCRDPAASAAPLFAFRSRHEILIALYNFLGRWAERCWSPRAPGAVRLAAVPKDWGGPCMGLGAICRPGAVQANHGSR